METLQPGLNRDRVESKLASLQLPEEFYELYQWRNGTRYESRIVLPAACIFLGADFTRIGESFVEIEDLAKDYNCVFMFKLDEYSLVLDLAR